MEGWKKWRTSLLGFAGGIAMVTMGASVSRADVIYGADQAITSALEMETTGFFIRGSSPPPVQQNQGPPVTTPPQTTGGGTTTTPEPPPPTGGGETPPGSVDPPVDPPVTSATPEPAGMAMALIGAGLAAGYSWRKRRKSVAE